MTLTVDMTSWSLLYLYFFTYYNKLITLVLNFNHCDRKLFVYLPSSNSHVHDNFISSKVNISLNNINFITFMLMKKNCFYSVYVRLRIYKYIKRKTYINYSFMFIFFTDNCSSKLYVGWFGQLSTINSGPNRPV